jgi:hypothetical protein
MLTVVMVYNTGGDYRYYYVERLAHAVRRNLSVEHEILCLTDDTNVFSEAAWKSRGVNRREELKHDLPGWWSKIELFYQKGPVLYLDLDTVVTGSLDPIAEFVNDMRDDQFMMLRGFYRNDRCSGVMAWHGDVSWIASVFVDRYLPTARFFDRSGALRMMHGGRRFRGDQEWLHMLFSVDRRFHVVLAQECFPGVYSYKVHVQDGKLPDDARLVCFHGRPRPHEVIEPLWMKEHWYGVGEERS